MVNEVKKLVDELNSYRIKYYNGEDTGITDEEFDFKERRLKELDPNNEYFYQVGAKTQTRDIPVEHEFPMLSMQKVQTAEDMVDWFFDLCEKFPNLYFKDNVASLLYEPKFDGISGAIVYDKDGNYKLATTRGDGFVGALIPFGIKIKGVLPKFSGNCELDGEFIIPKQYAKEFSGPLRNSCSGIIKRKDETDDLKYITFVTYDVRYYDNKDRPKFTDRIDKLNQIKDIALTLNGIEPIMIMPKRTINIPAVYEEYNRELRDKWPYQTDGMVFTIDGGQDNYDLINSRYTITTFNRYNIALKPPAEYGSSEVIDIIPSTNRLKVSFVAKVKPIIINGVTVQRATLDNYQNFKRMKIGIGSTVLMKRTNDVIPKIVESYNEEGKLIKMLDFDKCPCCGEKLIKVYQDVACPNEYGCHDLYKSKLEDLITGLNVKNIGPATVSAIVDWFQLNNYPLTFSTFFSFISVLDNIMPFLIYYYNSGNSKQAINFLNAKEFIFSDLTELKLMSNFDIPYIGEGLLIKHGITTIDKLLEYKKIIEKKDIIEDSFDIKFLNWFKDERHLKDLLDSCEILKDRFVKIHLLSNENRITYCISGEVPGFKNKQELINKLKEVNSNLEFVPSVTSTLDYLISVEVGTSKVLKAKKYKIPILSQSEMIKKFSN